MADLSVIIVSFNTKELLEKCLARVFASKTSHSFDVFVVDNASSDGSAGMVEKRFDSVKLIRNAQNLGYAKANNQALALASGRYILLLNSDMEIQADTFDKMIRFMDNNPTVGISSPRVEKPDGTLDHACRRSFPNPANSFFYVTGLSKLFPESAFSSYSMDSYPEDEILEVDSVMGAFLMIRKDAVDKIGPLDERFFMYGEDLDWCMRAKQAGFKVMYVPITRVVHHKGSSSRKLPGKALYEFHRAMDIFYEKHYRQKYNFLVNFMVKTGIWTRYLIKFLANSARSEKYVSR